MDFMIQPIKNGGYFCESVKFDKADAEYADGSY